jgi:two-component sensor histidine kinase
MSEHIQAQQPPAADWPSPGRGAPVHPPAASRRLTGEADWSWHVAVWALYVAVWTVLAVAEAYQAYFLSELIGRPLALWQCLLLSLAMWYGLALLAPLLIWLASLYPIEEQRWQGPILLLLAASALLALLKVAIDVPIERLIRPDYPVVKNRDDLELFTIFFNARYIFYLLVFWLILGVSQAFEFYRRYRRRELHATQLEAQLVRAELQVLKVQLHPHFLFNTLNAISALMHKDVELADRMIARLGELLRTTLENTGTQEVPLRHEIEFIKPYLEIEKARLGARLQVHLDIDPATLDARVPNLILQPLVENAIRHGVAPRAGPGRIEIKALRDKDLLHLSVYDNGRGLAAKYSEGVGVGNTRARLQQLYGAAQEFDMRNHPGGGLLVRVTIPFRADDGAGEWPANPAPARVS